MVEMAIVSAAILVPLLLLIPLLGKQVDIKHSTIQAARYEAWEYTVWYSGSGEQPDGFHSPASQPVKTTTATQREARQRFFSDPNLPITNSDSSGWNTNQRNPLWQTHVGQSLYSGAVGDDSHIAANQWTPDPTGIFTGILGALDTVFELLADIASFLSIDVGFTAINVKGFFHTKVAVDTQPVQGFITDTPLFPGTTVNAQAGVLADGWNAGGRPHAEFQIGGIVPTKILGEILEKSPFQEVMSVIGLFAPELRPCDPWIPLYNGDAGSLWLGYIDFDSVHPDRLTGDDSDGHVCDAGKVCNFDPRPVRTPTVVDSSNKVCAYVP